MKPLSDQTLYEVLEVPCDAPQGDILHAYERARALFGPDSLATFTLMAPDEAALLGAKLEEAHTILLDPIARARYDAQLSGTPAPRAGRGEDGTRPLPPIIPALRAKAEPGALVGAPTSKPPSPPAPLSPAPPPPAEATPIPIALETVATPIPLATLAAAPLPTPAPIPLSTLVHVSPPFAAVATQAPAAPAPAAPTPERGPAARASRVAQKDIFVHEGTRFTGDVLRRAREARGLTVQALSERTKITRHHIENLEADRYEKLPAAVYLRGFLMAIAKELRLDGQKVARSYLEAMAAAPAAAPSSTRSR